VTHSVYPVITNVNLQETPSLVGLLEYRLQLLKRQAEGKT
jgi:hypothetical protein